MRWCIGWCSTASARWRSNTLASPASSVSTRRARCFSLPARSARRICCSCRVSAGPRYCRRRVSRCGMRCQVSFQDHYIARMSCYVRDLETLNERARGLGFANEIMRYLVQGKGMMTFGASLCAASVKVLPESATPDLQCVFAPASYKPGLIRKLDDRPGITGGPWQMRPLSRGYVLFRTPDPRDQPAINPRYLAEDTDQRAMVGGLKFLRRVFAAPALADYIVVENLPGASVQSDDELLDYARSNGSTVYHASCSCMMGNHGMADVHDQLRVHGLEALRVVDASVMPAVSSTNTNAPTIMIAEKGAAMIKASAREKLAA